MRHPCPYIRAQNGRIEMMSHHVVEVGLCMITQAHMSLQFWWEAIHFAVFLIN